MTILVPFVIVKLNLLFISYGITNSQPPSDLGIPSRLKPSFSLPHSDWLHLNGTLPIPLPIPPLFTTTLLGAPYFSLALGIWLLSKKKTPNSTLAKECVLKAVEFHYLTSNKAPSRPRSTSYICWVKPPLGWSKLNADASVSSNPHFAGGGGLLCNSIGDWIYGFSHSVGSTSILLAELWALRDGLIMARSLGIQKIIVNVDASDINSLVSSSNSVNRLTQPPVADC